MSTAVPPTFAFDGVVRLTKVGTSYVLFTVVIGFAALNTGNNALYIGLTFLLGCLLLSGIASKGGLKHLRVEFAAIGQPWVGRPAHGMLRLHNDSRIWNVRDVVICGSELEPVLVPMVMRRSTMDVPVTLQFDRRGIVTVNRLDLYTRYPFGFFLKKRRIRINGEVIVYPRLLDGERERRQMEATAEGEIATNRIGIGGEVHSFREYVRGDSLRHVAWKKSASLGRWIIKQTEAEAAKSVHVVLDPFKPRGISDEAFEEMVSAAATYIYFSTMRGLEVSLSLPRVTLHSKADDTTQLFRALALIEPAHEPFAIPYERNAVVFSAGRHDDAQTA
jgi:uncharacterized protein (DUF58 family)